jgi:hypothetical protein
MVAFMPEPQTLLTMAQPVDSGKSELLQMFLRQDGL